MTDREMQSSEPGFQCPPASSSVRRRCRPLAQAAGRQEAHLCLWAARLCPSRWNSPESVLGPSLVFLGESSAFRLHGKTSVGRGVPAALLLLPQLVPFLRAESRGVSDPLFPRSLCLPPQHWLDLHWPSQRGRGTGLLGRSAAAPHTTDRKFPPFVRQARELMSLTRSGSPLRSRPRRERTQQK